MCVCLCVCECVCVCVCVPVCVCVCQCLHAWPVCGSFSVMSVSLCVSQSVCDSVYMSVVSICELWLSQSALISRSARACHCQSSQYR